TVPAGTIVQTERINGQIYSVVTTETVTIEKESALIAVDASDAGGAFNLAPGYFRILPVAVPGIERAQNEENWLLVPGADKESDDDLRDRCRNQYNLVGNYHTDAVYQGMIASVVGLSIDRIFFLHDAPRGAGTANAYLLLDSGVISQPFIDKVNDYVNTQGHHGHGDDMQCMPMPE
ncbi:baseplate J/gp47 family protein, partial [Proteus mirabilis]